MKILSFKKLKHKKIWFILMIIGGVLMFSYLLHSIFLEFTLPKIEVPKDPFHTTGNDLTSGKSLDYQDGYLYFLKGKNVVKISENNRKKQILHTSILPFMGSAPDMIRVVDEFVYCKMSTWIPSKKVRIDGKSISFINDKEDWLFQGKYSEGYVYGTGVETIVDNKNSRMDLVTVFRVNISTDTTETLFVQDTSQGVKNFLMDSYLVLCGDQLILTIPDSEIALKMNLDGSNQETVPALKNTEVIFSEKDEVYFRYMASGALGGGLYKLNINDNKITEIEPQNNKFILSYSEGIMVYSLLEPDKADPIDPTKEPLPGNYLPITGYYFSAKGQTKKLPDNFYDDDFVIAGSKIYYNVTDWPDNNPERMKLYCVSMDGQVEEVG